ncbi:MAG: S9 family peptidase [Acidobacteria bacterium]|nr:S9 family peptidase [Acidobacteriota bacterium]
MTTFARFASLLLAVTLFAAAAYPQYTWSPELQVKLKGLGSPEISPDGRKVVYTVNEAVMTADKSEFITHIWMANTDGRDNRQITFGDKSAANPKWSPDGSMIAFTSNRKDNRNQIYVLRVAGGEAEQITDGKGAVANFEWSPDGRSFAFTMTDPRTDEEEKDGKARNDFRWVDENVKLARLYLTTLAADAAGKREVKKIGDVGRHVTAFDWSPDGKRIAFAHVKSPVVDFWPTSDISIVDVSSGSVSVLAATEAAEANPMFSPNGNFIAASVSDLPVRWAQSNRIAIYPAGGGSPRKMAASFDGQPNMIAWKPDNGRIVFSEAKGTGTALYEATVVTGAVSESQYENSVISGITMAADGSMYAFVTQNEATAPEVHVVRSGAAATTRISSANAEYAKYTVPRTDVIKWKSKDGREIEGLLTYPMGYTAGTKVPLILNIHGGPAGVFNRNYVGGRGAYPLASLAAKGYAVLRPNPRGSSGYGVEFRRANIRDWGGMDYEDLMTGVDHVIAMGVADANRLGVMGWSYGGYMTSMIITKTDRFKVASAGAPVTNLMSFNGTADIPSFVPDYFEAEFWNDPAVYAKHSAMFNIKNAKTPTLIQHGENDIRVPISQGYELYVALKRKGVPTRMIVLPRQPHGIQEPRLQIATMQSNLDWFEKYLK